MKKILIGSIVALGLIATVASAATTLTFKTNRNNTSTIAQAAAALGETPAQFATENPSARLASGQTFSTTTGTVTPPPTCPSGTTGTPPNCVPVVTPPPTGNEITLLNVYTTGYGYPDNTPRNSANISNPVIHQTAGGTGTFTDPTTLAVGHSIIGGNDILDFPAGTKFYIPNLRKYFIVEDTCGDGNTPQNGPCHNISSADPGATLWLDLWVGGVGKTANGTIACEDAITANHTVIENPASNYAVVSGEVYNGTCQQQFGNAVVTQ